MLVKLIKEDKLVYCENVLEFAIITFNKDYEYINLGEL